MSIGPYFQGRTVVVDEEAFQSLDRSVGNEMLVVEPVLALTSAHAVQPEVPRAPEASVADLFKEPLHPYTQGLLRSIPRIDLAATERRRLETIPGTVPTLRGDIAPGCRFAPRCPFVKSVCTEKDPVIKEVKPGHKVACWLY